MTTKATATSQRYRILLTEVRVYAIEISSETEHDLEAWARAGWQPGTDNPDLELVESRLEAVTVTKADALPWGISKKRAA
ncbi:hypothetical protein [Xanthobacter wiegelii]|uniref:hypothetical protein n=1 Tax=Xanthobacter wiegelii TaxID=3119913 RepID=UPI00372A5D24